MEINSALRVNPMVILREEFDDWAVLFDPDSGSGYGLNPTGVIIWKQLDGQRTLKDIANVVKDVCDNVPACVEEDIHELFQKLIDKGLAGFENGEAV